jgi:hypothetical protein
VTIARAVTLIFVALTSASVGCRSHRSAVSQEWQAADNADEEPKSTVTMRIVGERGPLVRTRWAAEFEGENGYTGFLGEGISDDKGGVAMNAFYGTAHVQVWRGSERQPEL